MVFGTSRAGSKAAIGQAPLVDKAPSLGDADVAIEVEDNDAYERSSKPSAEKSAAVPFLPREALAALSPAVRTALTGAIKLVPAVGPKVSRLVKNRAFLALSPKEQMALVSKADPKRLDQAAALLASPMWSAFSGNRTQLLGLRTALQGAILAQAEHFREANTAADLARMSRTRWFSVLLPEDQMRAAKLVAYASSTLPRATALQAEILKNTLDALLAAPESVELRFDDMAPVDLGHREPPRTVVLNRAVLSGDASVIESAGLTYSQAEHLAVATVAHEVNHLINEVPWGQTFATFQDEYRAWFVGFIAQMGRFPNREEALGRCRSLFQNYVDIAAARTHKDEAEKIIVFMQKFGDVEQTEDGWKLMDPEGPAPLPDPPLVMNNAWHKAKAARTPPPPVEMSRP